MAERSAKVKSPNPFYVLLLVASTAFVLTVLGYLVSPVVLRQAIDNPQDGPGPASLALANWFEHRAPAALGVEIGVMLISGVLAMVSDHWLSSKRAQKPANSRPV